MKIRFMLFFVFQLFLLFNCNLLFSQEPNFIYFDPLDTPNGIRHNISQTQLNVSFINCLSFPESTNINGLGCLRQTTNNMDNTAEPFLKTTLLSVRTSNSPSGAEASILYFSPILVFALGENDQRKPMVNSYPLGNRFEYLFYPNQGGPITNYETNNITDDATRFSIISNSNFVDPLAPDNYDFIVEPDSYEVKERHLIIRVTARTPNEINFKTFGGGNIIVMKIPIMEQNQYELQNMNNLAENKNRIIDFCVASSYDNSCFANINKSQIYTVLGYGARGLDRRMEPYLDRFPVRNNYTFQPRREYSPVLIAVRIKVENNRIVERTLTWNSDDDSLTPFNNQGHRRFLIDKGHNILEKISNGQEYLDEPEALITFAKDNDADIDNDKIAHYTTMNFESKQLELFSIDGEIKNTMNANPKNQDQYHTFRVNGKELQSVAKKTDEVVYRYGENCLGSLDENSNYFQHEGHDYVMRTPEKITWRKLPAQDDVTCSFPTEGPSSLGVNQSWVQYNQPPDPNKNELNYLLSADGSKITIKIGNTIKVIDKSQFNGNFETAPTLQSFPLN